MGVQPLSVILSLPVPIEPLSDAVIMSLWEKAVILIFACSYASFCFITIPFVDFFVADFRIALICLKVNELFN